MILLISLGAANAFDLTLQWDPNTETLLAGYKLYYGNASGIYDVIVDVGKSETVSISGLEANTPYFFAVTAYDTSQTESGYSNEITHTIADIDHDGLLDTWEYKYALNIGSNDASADPDKDGYSNSQEYAAGSDPNNFNSCPNGMSLSLLQTILTILDD